jgi:hypothetical protein
MWRGYQHLASLLDLLARYFVNGNDLRFQASIWNAGLAVRIRFDIPVRLYLIDDRFWMTGGKKLGVGQFSADVNAIFPMNLLSSEVGRWFASNLWRRQDIFTDFQAAISTVEIANDTRLAFLR